ncbi:MAG: hypothetical protein DME19_17765 [Verrucomicrobia bacterium]|nr:MAG: hypothetical protein DME19_17765 [Verrucomicrobiota bacterium]
MSEPRYRISILKEKAFRWDGWYSNYGLEPQAVTNLANAIDRDIEKFKIHEVKPNKNISAEKRKLIIRAALIKVAESLSPN